VTYSFVDSALQLFLLRENMLENVDPKIISECALQFVSYVKSVYHSIYEAVYKTGDITPEVHTQLLGAAQEFSKIFVPKQI
jgi:hypothetical protein